MSAAAPACVCGAPVVAGGWLCDACARPDADHVRPIVLPTPEPEPIWQEWMPPYVRRPLGSIVGCVTPPTAKRPEALVAATRRHLADLGFDELTERTGHTSGSGQRLTRAEHARPARDDWTPPGEAAERVTRQRMFGIRQALRKVNRPRIRACGFACLAGGNGGVGVVADPEGRCRLTGVQHCGSVWECAVCAMSIKSTRANELARVLEQHGHARAAMLTLTIRHGIGDDLRKLRSALGAMWRRFTRGAPYKRWAARMGIVGYVRALEVTHGRNGWHPHLHVLFLLDRAIPASELLEVDGVSQWMPTTAPPPPRRLAEVDEHEASDRGWAVARWRRVVLAELGEAHLPDDAIGVALTPCHQARYLSKLGLELSDPGIKKGRRGGRTPFQIAADWARNPNGRDARLWLRYCDDMRGARQLTWSRGLKARHGIDERTDQECAEEDEATPQEVTIARLAPVEWEAIRGMWEGGRPAVFHLIRTAEERGARALRRELARLMAPDP